MSLQPCASSPDPELWRAVHERPGDAVALPACAPQNAGVARSPHGMPADRLAMAASLHAMEAMAWRPAA